MNDFLDKFEFDNELIKNVREEIFYNENIGNKLKQKSIKIPE